MRSVESESTWIESLFRTKHERFHNAIIIGYVKRVFVVECDSNFMRILGSLIYFVTMVNNDVIKVVHMGVRKLR